MEKQERESERGEGKEMRRKEKRLDVQLIRGRRKKAKIHGRRDKWATKGYKGIKTRRDAGRE